VRLLRIPAATAALLAIATAAAGADPRCPVYSSGIRTGRIADDRIHEASGLAASAHNKGILWIHNDSGDKPRIFAITPRGRTVGVYNLPSAVAYDWEDIAIGPGPKAAVDYIYIGDIGDNGARRNHVSIYRVEEPRVPRGAEPVEADLDNVTAFHLRYPDGPQDAEVLLSDPISGDLIILTKDFANGRSGIYRFRYPHAPDTTRKAPATLELVGKMSFYGARAADVAVTAGDVSPSGDAVLLRTYTQALVWPRALHTNLGHELMTVPCPDATVGIGFPFDQYESAAFSSNGRSYYTVSEGAHRYVRRFDLRDAPGDQ